MTCIKTINFGILLVTGIGILLSLYALKVEFAKEEDENYSAMCDISEHVSCSKVFMSEYGKGFGIIAPIFGEDTIINQPNSFYGIIFYISLLIANFKNDVKWTKILIFLNIISNIGSVYLAYLLYFVLYDFCVVCVCTYFVNFINLILSVKKLSHIKKQSTNVKKEN